jgi:colanic acid/amylovoran biosynthesis glycosyltransferase
MTCVVHCRSIWLPQTETWLYNQVRYLPDQIDSHVICSELQNLEQFSLPHIHRVVPASEWEARYLALRRRCGLSDYLPRMFDQLRALRPDLLHVHFGDHAWSLRKLSARLRVPLVATFYGYDVEMLPAQDARWRERYRELFLQVRLVLCEGPHMAKRIRELGCEASKVRVHHLGISLDELPFRPRSFQPGSPLRVLLAAGFRSKKGLPYALQALSRVAEQVPLEITIIGDASSEERSQREKQRIMDVINTGGLTHCTRLLGFQPHRRMIEEAYTHHVFLSPSVHGDDGDTEGGAPVSLIEMAATGMPLVSTFHCDIPEVISHRETGLLAEERNVEQLTENLLWLCRNPEAWPDMLAKGRQRIEEQFSAAIQGRKLGGLYAELLNTAS